MDFLVFVPETGIILLDANSGDQEGQEVQELLSERMVDMVRSKIVLNVVLVLNFVLNI